MSGVVARCKRRPEQTGMFSTPSAELCTAKIADSRQPVDVHQSSTYIAFMEQANLTEEQIRNLLRDHGVTPTTPRMIVAVSVLVRHDHPTAEDVLAQVRTSEETVSQATVYNTLNRLVEAGLLRTLQRPGDPVRYDPNITPHHHFYDVETGCIHDIDVETVSVMLSDDLKRSVDVSRISVMVEGRYSG